MTYHELVEKVQTALAKADASKVENHIAVQVNVTGEAEGAFYMEISDGVLYVAPFTYNDRDGLLTGEAEEILNVAEGKISIKDAAESGKIFCECNSDEQWQKVLTLGSVIPVKKTGRKPAAAKAEEVKEKAEAKVEEVKEVVEAKAEEVKEKVTAKVEEVKETVKEAVDAKVEEIKADAPKKRGRKPADKPAAAKTVKTTKKTTSKKKK